MGWPPGYSYEQYYQALRRCRVLDAQHGGAADSAVRQAAYDLRKLRGHNLVTKPGRGRRYHVPAHAARTITARLVLRDHVIAPILAGVRSPRPGRKPAHWTAVDRRYETLRIDMQNLLSDFAIDTQAA